MKTISRLLLFIIEIYLQRIGLISTAQHIRGTSQFKRQHVLETPSLQKALIYYASNKTFKNKLSAQLIEKLYNKDCKKMEPYVWDKNVTYGKQYLKKITNLKYRVLSDSIFNTAQMIDIRYKCMKLKYHIIQLLFLITISLQKIFN